MITIQGLTKQQYQIADMIWSCDSQEDVDRLIQNLPVSYKKDAVVIHQMMIAAVMDQYEEITEDVQSVIDRIRHS
jgi:23S rRNA C2498 (ribose-2'-O)-methylase RlmM